MTTKQTILDYFASIHAGNWQDYISDTMAYGFNTTEQKLNKNSTKTNTFKVREVSMMLPQKLSFLSLLPKETKQPS